ncbi:MAG: hypothetical protein DI533_00265 [Cereibacter sphaeroides]|uniref:Uncharacterized protein n=1 Tax=Cereibacter sphaeroides TaxID=1063 RepID=A0A2W5TTA4_CERSP|nr:MAG: hypothetical protein DI533_00265 [Cereibacter sphaeroides]
MRRMTQSEAEEFIGTTFNTVPELSERWITEVTVVDVSVKQAEADRDSFLSIIASPIDPESIVITPDQIEGSDLECVRIVIRTDPEAA